MSRVLKDKDFSDACRKTSIMGMVSIRKEILVTSSRRLKMRTRDWKLGNLVGANFALLLQYGNLFGSAS